MPFTYSAKKIREESSSPYLPEGIYDFECVSCVEGVTAAGIDKLVLKLNIYGHDGSKHNHQIHITENNAYHLKAFWEAVGSPEMFDSLENNHDEFAYIGKSGKVKTNVQENEWKGEVTKRINVSYFVKPDKDEKAIPYIAMEAKKTESKEDFMEDEIPF